MSTHLTKRETTFLELLPDTPKNIGNTMGLSMSHVYGVAGNLKQKGFEIMQDGDGRYHLEGEPPEDAPSNTAQTRMDSSSKSTKTRKAKEILAKIEYEMNQRLDEMEPADGVDIDYEEGETDLIIHRTDDHFGEVIENQHGEEVFNSEIAEERVRSVFENSLEKAKKRAEMGVDFGNAHLLLGGDIVTNETIYEQQSSEIDENLHDQINRAARVYVEGIRRLSDRFDAVQVACQAGNHGRLGKGSTTNADNIVYSMIEKVVKESEMDNVTFLRSDKSYYLDFQIRDWNVHLRHGHDSSLEHIGTSAGKQRWLTWLVDHEFDVAFRGHYHMYKEEPIAGRPVHMGGSITPQSDFEESHALSGRPVGAIHGCTDTAPTEWSEKIYFG